MIRWNSNRSLWMAAAFAAVALLALACNGGGEAQPTATAEAEATATPGPTVETLAFIRDGDIWLIGADGSNERRLNLSNVESFAWISAAEIDVATGDEPPRHLSVNLQGNVRELPFPAGGSWSRDGSLYVVPVDQEVVVFNRDGSEAARLEVEPPVEGGEKPRPCGVPLFNGEPDRLVFSRPALSPDSQRVFVAVNCMSRAGATGNLYAPVYEASLDGEVERTLPLQTNLEDVTVARFSPDGSRIAQAIRFGGSACGSELVLSVAESNGETATELTLPAIVELHDEPRTEIAGGIYSYDWSPDSEAVVASIDVSVCRYFQEEPFVEVEEILAGLYLLRLDGLPEEQLVEGPTRSPAWAPSGQSIAFEAGDFGQRTEAGEYTDPPIIRLLDMTTREVIDLGPGSQPAWQPQP